VKAITLHQPWASLIACGLKTIETRTHDRFRSLVGETVAIHAGKRSGPGPSYRFMIKHNIREDYYDEALEHASTHRGCIVCVVLAIGHKRLSVLDECAAACECSGRFGLIVNAAQRFREPIPATGHQGIWQWTPPANWRGLVV
jgi:hypothetical protein